MRKRKEVRYAIGLADGRMVVLQEPIEHRYDPIPHWRDQLGETATKILLRDADLHDLLTFLGHE